MIDDLRNYLYIGSAALSIGAMVYTWLSARGKANAQAIAELADRLASQQETNREHLLVQEREFKKQLTEKESELLAELHRQDTRIAKVEAALSAIPEFRGDIARVFTRIDGVSKTANHIDGQLGQMNKTMGLVVQHLMGDNK